MESPEHPAVSSAALNPTGFYSQKLWGFIFLVLESWAVCSGLGLGLLAPKVSLPIFIHHMWMWVVFSTATISITLHLQAFQPISVTLLPLPVWVNVASLNPWLSDFHTAQFSWQFWMLFWDLVVILSMVAQGGQAHLPMPSSWPEVSDPAFCSLDRSWTLEFRNHMANLIFDFNFS